MRFRCFLGIHEYENTWEEDIERCVHCGQIHRKGFVFGIKLMLKYKK